MAADFQISEGTVSIRQADYEHTVYYDEVGYPHIAWDRYDRHRHGIVEREHPAVVLENRYVRIMVLPRLGRIYSFVFKPTGHEEFWVNKVAKPLGALNDTGWWMIWGGVENTLPGGEHGTTWALPWDWEIVEDSEARKALRMGVQEPKTKLLESLEVAIYPDRAGLELTVTIFNPNQADVRYAHWINPMWAPGGRGELTPDTEFIVPADSLILADKPFNAWMGERRQPYAQSPLRFAKNWKDIGDLIFTPLKAGFYSAYAHEAEEGVARVFDLQITPGVDIWTWGYPPPEERQREYTDAPPNMGYVEIWGGVARWFGEEDRVTLAAGSSLSWTEWMYAYQRTGGLTWAMEEMAACFTEERGRIHIGLCPTGPMEGVRVAVVRGQGLESMTVLEETVDMAPDAPYRKVIDAGPAGSGSARLAVIYEGRTLIECTAQAPSYRR